MFTGGLTCYCEGIHCPKGQPNGTTCELKQGGKCFVSLDRQYDEETQTYEYYKDFGCFNADDVNFQVSFRDLILQIKQQKLIIKFLFSAAKRMSLVVATEQNVINSWT